MEKGLILHRRIAAYYERRCGHSAFADQVLAGAHDALIYEIDPMLRGFPYSQSDLMDEQCSHCNTTRTAAFVRCADCGYRVVNEDFDLYHPNFRHRYDVELGDMINLSARVICCAFLVNGDVRYFAVGTIDNNRGHRRYWAAKPLYGFDKVVSSVLNRVVDRSQHAAAVLSHWDMEQALLRYGDTTSTLTAIKDETKRYHSLLPSLYAEARRDWSWPRGATSEGLAIRDIKRIVGRQ